jgi:hypothetical protein
MNGDQGGYRTGNEKFLPLMFLSAGWIGLW